MTWIFTYGSLMGDNATAHFEGHPARLTGFHRSFNHESTRRWGSPTHPCPTIGLTPGGECTGVAYQLSRAQQRALLRKLRHSDGNDEFNRKRVRIDLLDDRSTKALAWVTSSKILQRPRWPNEKDMQQAFRDAHGLVGNGIEYIRELVHAMNLWKIDDPLIESLWETLKP